MLLGILAVFAQIYHKQLIQQDKIRLFMTHVELTKTVKPVDQVMDRILYWTNRQMYKVAIGYLSGAWLTEERESPINVSIYNLLTS